jgi:metal-sulfur cluster biosynthetic enzyme
MSEEIKSQIQDKLAMIADPHMGVSIVQMGLVRDIQYDEETKEADITICPTNPGCMSVANIAMAARLEAEKIEGVDKAKITVIEHMMADTINEMVNKDE